PQAISLGGGNNILQSRNGFVMGEGAGDLLLKELEHAKVFTYELSLILILMIVTVSYHLQHKKVDPATSKSASTISLRNRKQAYKKKTVGRSLDRIIPVEDSDSEYPNLPLEGEHDYVFMKTA
ncbi:3-oxoacyl-[acyl-carrier-protein] synthase II, chloroplastic-like protein, partial [Tanacetum coccineum]